MVEYRDGSTLAQLGPSDMRVPIASTLAWPARMDTPCEPLDLAAIGTLTFRAPDEVRFPATRLAREAAEAGGARPRCSTRRTKSRWRHSSPVRLGSPGLPHMSPMCSPAMRRPRPAFLADVIAVDAEARLRARALLELA